jgi:hypothetical protein
MAGGLKKTKALPRLILFDYKMRGLGSSRITLIHAD